MLSKVVAKNFQSWKDLQFEVNTGITLIDGMNEDDQTSEGSGKSSILNAMSWAAFGKLPKDVKIDEVIKDGESSCAVALLFDSGDSIYRSRKPNELFITLASGKVIKGKDLKETQEMIEEYLGCNFETFCQSIYFAQNYDAKFLQSNQEAKGKILSSIQNLQIFDKARKEVMDLLKLENDKILKLNSSLQLEENNLKHLQSKAQMVDSFIEKKINDHKARLVVQAQKIADLETKRFELVNKAQKVVSDREALNVELGGHLDSKVEFENTKLEFHNQLNQLSVKKSQVDNNNRTFNSMSVEGRRQAEKYSKLEQKKAKIQEFINNPQSECPTCGAPVTNVDLSHSLKELEDVDQELIEIMARLTELSGFLNDHKLESVDDLNAQERDLKSQLFQVDQILAKIKLNQKTIDQLNQEHTNLVSMVTYVQSSLVGESAILEGMSAPDISEDQKSKETINQQLIEKAEAYAGIESLMEATKKYAAQLEALKDGFKEIKSYVFNNALSELNYRTNQYLNSLFEMEASIKFKNEDQKIESEITIDGRTSSIGLLSGGQNRRFNMAVDLALSDIVNHRKNSKFGILVMDENFKDLSESSMEKCLDILKSRKSPVILIEHNSLFKTVVSNTFFVRLKNGTSEH